MAEEQQQSGAIFSLEKIYLKDLSYEAPSVPQAFLEQNAPQMEIHMDISHHKLDGEEDLYEVVLPVTVTAKLEDKTVFLVELQQAGVFHISGLPDNELSAVLEIGCPNVLLPFARETVSSLANRGGFPPVLINPVNFEALYHQRQVAQQQKANTGE